VSEFSRYHFRVKFHDTDAMGVIHHSKHIKYFEEARVEFLREKEMKWHNRSDKPLIFAVVSLATQYLKPARFDEELQVWTQARLQGARIQFQYAIFSELQKSFIALGTTELIALDDKLIPKRLPKDLVQAFKSIDWNENWPPKL